jgi:very-short-patch-repair endonuclease
MRKKLVIEVDGNIHNEKEIRIMMQQRPMS